MAGKHVVAAQRANLRDMDRKRRNARTREGIPVGRPQIEAILAVGTGMEESSRTETKPLDRRHANLLADLITFRPGRRTDAGHQIRRDATAFDHPAYHGRCDSGHRGPP